MMHPQEVAFSVELPGVVELARSLVLEGKWRRALSVLRLTATPALSLDTAVAILTGDSTLEDTEAGGRVVAQDPEDPALKRYLATAIWQNAGLLEQGGEFYQPYGYIAEYTSADADDVMTRLEQYEDYMSMARYREARSRWHMRHPESDLVVFDIAPYPVLFERVQGPAFWVKTFTDPGEALADFRTQRPNQMQGLVSRTTAAPEASPNRWEFYFPAVVKGLVYRASYEEPELPPDQLDKLGQIMEWREDLEDRLSQMDDNADEVDDAGYVVNKATLREEFLERAQLLLYQDRIHRQAERSGGFMTLRVKDGDQTQDLRVPRAPFLLWATRQDFGKQRGTLPVWRSVCPQGLKMLGDNPLHTDWLVGAGLEPRLAYDTDHPVNKAAWNYAFGLAYAEGADCVKLAGSGKVTGAVVFPKPNETVPAGSIAVVSHAGPDYEMALLSACKDGAGAVVAEVGGKLAHLAIVSRELGARLIVVEGALSKFKQGELVTIDLDTSKLQIHGRQNPFEDD